MDTYLKLKMSNCQNCYKCIRNCPVKSIKFSSNQANIIADECILCGQCFVVCPQNAKEIRDDTHKAKKLIANGEKVIASLAPSFVANFSSSTIETLTKALKAIGFSDVQETALGATVVKNAYTQIIKEQKQSVMISSCCPTINALIQKYYPEALPYLAKVLTPMQTHGKMIKEKDKNAKVVFIGPCISKKHEADEDETYIDCVLTFEELANWLNEENVEVEQGEKQNDIGKARFFPTTGGILKTMELDDNYSYLAFDGVDNCIEVIKDILDGKITNCFVEMSACVGSCAGGPVLAKKQYSPVKDTVAVHKYAGKVDFEVEKVDTYKNYQYIGLNRTMPGTSDIKDILKKMGKTTEADELNCGACGYNTCKEKAIAVYFGKADLSMCLPFLKEKAESFSETIIKNTPNAIIVLNEALEIQQVNTSARKMFNIKNISSIIGEQVIRILEPKIFLDVMESGRNVRDQRVYLPEYDRYVEKTIIYDRSYHILMCIMRDVTDEENGRKRKEEISTHTVEVTNKVIEKQMRVVQEIALLLGETTAETKIALTKLKDSLNDE
ncbi:MAG: [Fe-Fe] hydrogenase large subunit C-terminal domain-containing protein [Clostridia bacterium]